jgi:hypothetical protein
MKIYQRDGLSGLEKFIPDFIKDPLLTSKTLQANISLGVTLEQAQQTIASIDLEHQAHSRAGMMSSKMRRKIYGTARARSRKELRQVMLQSSEIKNSYVQADNMKEEAEKEFKTPKKREMKSALKKHKLSIKRNESAMV